jgi:acetyl-CoA C-acetyltransferase
MSRESVFVVGAKRTPIGSFQGTLSSFGAPALGAVAIRAALSQAGVSGAQVEQVMFGNVLSAGIGQAPARQAALAAGLPDNVPCTTVSKVCGSGLESVILAARALALGDAQIAVAGGMESMSRVPYYLEKARTGYRMGDGALVDGMIKDGLWDPYGNHHMGTSGELCAREFNLDRAAQDAFATESYRRAMAAQDEGLFTKELAPVTLNDRGMETVISVDEEPGRGKPEKFASLKPVFAKDGTITAANASSISDGAAALVLCTESALLRYELTPLARIVGYGSAAQSPEWFTTAPAKAIDAAFRHAGVTREQVDLFEINEAFSCVTMACSRLANLDPATVNVHGGAVALGHPIGASGARILTTLLYALEARGKRRGLATLCIGGGEAVAVVIERV